jgi:hypothetical protein
VIKELQDVGFFCTEHPAFAQTKTRPIERLMGIRDPEIKEKVISSVEKSLESGKNLLTGILASWEGNQKEPCGKIHFLELA